MSTRSSRFSLRTRKSMKLLGQIECSSCQRFYFPPENSDDENDDVDEQTENSEQLCCDCEEKKAYKSPPRKRRAIQQQNGVPSPIVKVIKQEQIDPADLQANNGGYNDRVSPIANQNTTNGINHFNCDSMVQIHTSELLKQPMLPLSIDSEY